ncbi:MAG: hypothetical protein IPL13_12200 [Saprospiraceae bacterium]|nr:hypothetical protein [Candidatus Brachybacter algidus]
MPEVFVRLSVVFGDISTINVAYIGADMGLPAPSVKHKLTSNCSPK